MNIREALQLSNKGRRKNSRFKRKIQGPLPA